MAANLAPSAEEATRNQPDWGALVCVQVAPEFVETQMPLLPAVATNLVPSADEATAVQFVSGALVCVQVWASAKLAVSKAVEAASRILKFFIGRLMNLLHSTILWNHCQVSLFLWLPDCLGVVAGRFVLCPRSTRCRSRRSC